MIKKKKIMSRGSLLFLCILDPSVDEMYAAS